MEFVADARYLAIAEAYALDAIDFAKDHFKVDLDRTEGSIRSLEEILDVFHVQLSKSRPSSDQIVGFSKMWGSYFGEVLRKNHGATWGLVTSDGNSFPGMQATNGVLFWPWGRVENRLVDGPENNVWHYYQHLIGKS